MPVFLKEIPPRPELPAPPERNLNPIDAEELAILYVMLIHDNAQFTKRIIEALDEPQHTFVIHVDLKAKKTYKDIKDFAKNRNNIIIVEHFRQGLNWGGYSIVNATIISMHFGYESQRKFDYLINLSGTHYPIKSNREIRKRLAAQPGAIYMEILDIPNQPGPDAWFHYVECDDALHRIGRMPLLRGMNMFVGSQWFALPRHIVQWILQNPLPVEYATYAQHIIVADENFFATLIKNSPYCSDPIKSNLLFVLFDKWEQELAEEKEAARDTRKCLTPDPDQCGRSPTTLTLAFKRLLRASKALFARKFDPRNQESMELVDLIDGWRVNDGDDGHVSTGDEGLQFMIRQNNNYGLTKAEESLCLQMLDNDAGIVLTSCNPLADRQWFTIGNST
jgi:hypothetical protein